MKLRSGIWLFVLSAMLIMHLAAGATYKGRRVMGPKFRGKPIKGPWKTLFEAMAQRMIPPTGGMVKPPINRNTLRRKSLMQSPKNKRMQYFNGIGGLSDMLTPPMTLDEAFKQGYESGKSVAIGDALRNPNQPCGWNNPGCSVPSIYNIFFPPSNGNGVGLLPPDINPGPGPAYGVDEPLWWDDYPTIYDDYYGNYDDYNGIYDDYYGNYDDYFGGYDDYFDDDGSVLPPPPRGEVSQPGEISVGTNEKVFVTSDGITTPVLLDSTGTTFPPVGDTDAAGDVAPLLPSDE